MSRQGRAPPGPEPGGRDAQDKELGQPSGDIGELAFQHSDVVDGLVGMVEGARALA
jgi:hypothetical protein